jgi:hypothetical protein
MSEITEYKIRYEGCTAEQSAILSSILEKNTILNVDKVCFIDLENIKIAINLKGSPLDFLLKYLIDTVSYIYYPDKMEQFRRMRNMEHWIRVSSLKKQAVDLILIKDAMEYLDCHNPKNFTLISGDGDFAPLIIYAKKKGCFITIVSTEQTISNLLQIADKIVTIKPLIKKAEELGKKEEL